MEFNIFHEELSQKLQQIDIEITERQTQMFYEYMNILIEWNEKMNLTTIINPTDIITKHFLDSLTILKHIKDGSSIIDIGTGAGFPGIPLKIYREDTRITLLDSLNKRIVFLEEVINTLRMKNIQAIHARAEEFGRLSEYREQYDIATSRAVSSLNSLLEYMSPFIKVGGKLICMKGPKLMEELDESKNAMKELGLEVVNLEQIALPNMEMERNLLIVKKIASTPDKYPRRATNIKKLPL